MQRTKTGVKKQPGEASMVVRLDPQLKPELLEVRAIMESKNQEVVSIQKAVSDLIRRGLECYRVA